MEENKCKITFSVLIGTISSLYQQYAAILILVILAICLDVVTGLIKSKVTGESINSKKGTVGFWKKMSFLVSLLFGIFMDVFIPVLLTVINIQLPFNCPFGFIVGVYIILNESISICENIYKTNTKAIPKWLIDFLTASVKEIDNKNNKNNKNKK